ncbi:FxSxx-COOH system tetratricopeptide repeat protein [Streptomyces sp. NPDC055287]
MELADVSAGGDVVVDQRSVHVQLQRRPAPPSRAVRLAPRPARLVGREELLTVMEERLTSPGPRPRLLALHGLGGVGKTSLALEYAHRHESEYGLIWQLPAEDPTVLSASCGRLARLLGARDLVDSADPVDQVHAALAVRTDRWLLLFDNVTDADALRELVPPAGDGHVLITSRSAHWPDNLDLSVPLLDPEVAARYLMTRTGDEDQDAAAELAGELGALPLALEQAASYIRENSETLHQYLAEFREHRPELLARGESWGHTSPVASTWELSFQRLQDSAPAAITLLRLLACCAPEAIPIKVLVATRDEVPAIDDAEVSALVASLLHDPFAVTDAMRSLRRYSLISSPTRGTVAVHRLVQAVTLDRLPATRARAWREATAMLVEIALPDEPHRPQTWPTYAALVPHARAVLAPGRPGARSLVAYLGASGDYQTARIVQQEVHADALRQLGPEHPETLAARAVLATWTGMAGNPGAAREVLAELAPVYERALGSEDPRTLTVAAQLADWTGQSGDWPRARDLCAALLPVLRRVLGEEHPDTLTVWADLGFWTGQAGNAAAACAHYAELLPIRERVLGPEHPDVLSARDQYARWIGQTGDAAGARDLCLDILVGHERFYGAEHHSTLWARSTLAWWTGMAGDAEGARDRYTGLLEVRERVSGPEHPATLNARGNLAWWMAQAGDAAGARDQFAALLPVHLRILGPDHPETLLDRKNLAHYTGEAGDPAGARDQFGPLAAAFERALGPEHGETLDVQAKLVEWTARAAGRRGRPSARGRGAGPERSSGTTFDVPDTEANSSFFGRPGSG